MQFIIFFLISFAFALILTPIVRKAALMLGAVDTLELRKMHTKRIIVRLGGIAIFVSFYLTVLLFKYILPHVSFGNMLFIKGVFISSSLILALGIYDDVRGADAKLKFSVQIIASLVILHYGIKIELFSNPFRPEQAIDIGYWGIPLTIFWIIFITNSLNLLDGLDGLAAGVSCIILITIFCIAAYQKDYLIMALSISLAGATVGFLRYNFNPAKIFMGDTGSLFLGFVLAVLSVKGSHKSATTVTLLIPVIAMGLPIIDTLLAITRRFSAGKNVFRADNEHIHHRLIKTGLSHRKVVLVLYGFSVLLGIIAFLLSVIKNQHVAIILTVVIVTVFIIFKCLRLGKRQRQK